MPGRPRALLAFFLATVCGPAAWSGQNAPQPQITAKVQDVDWSSPKICNDAWTATCAQGEVDDGTGAASNIQGDKIKELRDQARIRLSTSYLRKLADPDFKTLAKNAFNTLPECQSALASNDENCTTALAVRLAQAALKKTALGSDLPDASPSQTRPQSLLFGALIGPRNRDTDLSSFEQLSNDPNFKGPLDQINRSSGDLAGTGAAYAHIENDMLPELKPAIRLLKIE